MLPTVDHVPWTKQIQVPTKCVQQACVIKTSAANSHVLPPRRRVFNVPKAKKSAATKFVQEAYVMKVGVVRYQRAREIDQHGCLFMAIVAHSMLQIRDIVVTWMKARTVCRPQTLVSSATNVVTLAVHLQHMLHVHHHGALGQGPAGLVGRQRHARCPYAMESQHIHACAALHYQQQQSVPLARCALLAMTMTVNVKHPYALISKVE